MTDDGKKSPPLQVLLRGAGFRFVTMTVTVLCSLYEGLGLRRPSGVEDYALV